jgi:hypothetical protein
MGEIKICQPSEPCREDAGGGGKNKKIGHIWFNLV